MATITPATIDDLYRVDGKAELIAGRIVQIMPSGKLHARASARILFSLYAFVEQLGIGEAFGDALGYALTAPLSSGRQSFCPDVSYCTTLDDDEPEKFVTGPPTFAVEVRSENDYGRAAEINMAAKRADYFEAGTLVVWDVDPAAQTVTIYRNDAPPRLVRIGEVADGEPAIAGWTLSLDELFK